MKRFLLLALLFVSQSNYAVKSGIPCPCNGKDGQVWFNNAGFYEDSYEGGCVANSAYVAKGVTIEAGSVVCGNAEVVGSNIRIYGNARVLEDAIVDGADISLGGGAIIRGNAVIGSNTRVRNMELTSGYYSNQRLNGKDYAREENIKKIQEEISKNGEALTQKIVWSDFELRYSITFPKTCTMNISTNVYQPGIKMQQTLRINLEEEKITSYSPARTYVGYETEQKADYFELRFGAVERVWTAVKRKGYNNRRKEFHAPYLLVVSDAPTKMMALYNLRKGIQELEKACQQK